MVKNASDNEVNVLSKNTLLNFNLSFKGLSDVVALFFPSMREAMVERYRAETIAKIGGIANNIARDANIEINPIPPKMSLPLIEKMSLEHEEDMYDMWARLLVASGKEYNPIQIQYIDILSKLGNFEAKLLKDVYLKQRGKDGKDRIDSYERLKSKAEFDEAYKSSRIQEQINHIAEEVNSALSSSINSAKSFSRRVASKPTVHVSAGHFTFPYYYPPDKDNPPYIRYISDLIDAYKPETESKILSLVKLGLIEKEYTFYFEKNESRTMERKHGIGIILTEFGYSFIECLENADKFSDNCNREGTEAE